MFLKVHLRTLKTEQHSLNTKLPSDLVACTFVLCSLERR